VIILHEAVLRKRAQTFHYFIVVWYTIYPVSNETMRRVPRV